MLFVVVEVLANFFEDEAAVREGESQSVVLWISPRHKRAKLGGCSCEKTYLIFSKRQVLVLDSAKPSAQNTISLFLLRVPASSSSSGT